MKAGELAVAQEGCWRKIPITLIDLRSTQTTTQSSGRLVFRYGHVHSSAVDPNGIDLTAVRRDELPRHACQLVGIDVHGFADAVQKAAGVLFAVHVVLPVAALYYRGGM